MAAILWGTTGTAQAFAPAAAHPVAVGALRLLVGGGVLLLWAAVRRTLPPRRLWSHPAVLLAAAGMAAYQPFFFAGVRDAGVAAGTMVAIGSAPILAGLAGWLLWQKRPSPRWFGATLLALTGCALLIFTSDSAAPGRAIGRGILLALGAGAAYVIYPFAMQQARKTGAANTSPPGITAVIFTLAALFLLPLLFFFELRWLAAPRGMLAIAHLGLLATAAAYLFYGYGLQRVEAATAVTLALAEPLTATLLSLLLLREPLSAAGWLGISLLLAGLIWLGRDAR